MGNMICKNIYLGAHIRASGSACKALTGFDEVNDSKVSAVDTEAI